MRQWMERTAFLNSHLSTSSKVDSFKHSSHRIQSPVRYCTVVFNHNGNRSWENTSLPTEPFMVKKVPIIVWTFQYGLSLL